MERDFFSLKEIQSLFGLSQDDIDQWIEEGLPTLVMDGETLVVKENLYEWSHSHGIQPVGRNEEDE